MSIGKHLDDISESLAWITDVCNTLMSNVDVSLEAESAGALGQIDEPPVSVPPDK